MAFEFDRYINGQLMAEGVTIERQRNLPDAMRAAARIASRGSNGEVPVLVLRALAERAGGVKVLHDLSERLAALPKTDRGFSWENKNYRRVEELTAYGETAALFKFILDNTAEILTALTTEPAILEGRQAVAWLYDWTDDDGEAQTDASTHEVRTVNFKPVRNVRPLFTRPAEQTVTEAGVEAAARYITGWLGFAWDGLHEGRVTDKGFPIFTHGQFGWGFQGHKGDMIDLSRTALAAALAQKEEGR